MEYKANADVVEQCSARFKFDRFLKKWRYVYVHNVGRCLPARRGQNRERTNLQSVPSIHWGISNTATSDGPDGREAQRIAIKNGDEHY